jgi:hypothetical protein
MSIIGISGKIGSGKDTVAEIINYSIDMTERLKETSDWEKQYKIKPFTERGFKDWQCCTGGANEDSFYFQNRKFADTLKDIVCLLIGCTREQLEDQEFKNKELGEEWWFWKDKRNIYKDKRSPHIIREYIFSNDDRGYHMDKDFELVKPTPRYLLQHIGTDLFRNQLHLNIWVNALFSEYKLTKPLGLEGHTWDDGELPNWIITDMRFLNELKAVEDRDGITIRVNRDRFEMVPDANGVPMKVKVTSPLEHESETALDNAEFDYVLDNNSSIEDLIVKVKEILIKEKLI